MRAAMARAIRASALAALMVWTLGANGCPPSVSDEAVLARYSPASFDVLSVSGRVFGAPQADSYVEVVDGSGATITVNSQAPETLEWKKTQVVVKLPKGTAAVSARVHTPGGFSQTSATVKTYDAKFFSMRDATGIPIKLLGEPGGRIFLNSEFHTNLSAFDPATATVVPFADYPVPPVPIYHGCNADGCSFTQVATFGEGVALDNRGRVYLTEGGMEPQWMVDQPNHSRILAAETNANPLGTRSALRLYNLPGDRNSVIGVAWDEPRQRIWFSQSRNLSVAGSSAALVSFDPERIPHDDFDFDWAPTAACDIPPGEEQGTCSNAAWQACASANDCVLAEQICPPDVVDDSACYHEYPVPGFQPAQIAVHPDGSIWYANYYLGNFIGRLDPSTGEVSKFTLSPSAIDVNGFRASWPWQVKVAANGDVWATEFVAERLAHIPAARQHDSCEALIDISEEGADCGFTLNTPGPTCKNPCVEEFDVPGAVVKQTDGTLVSALKTVWFDFGPGGRIFFDQGYRLPNGQFVFFPELSRIFPGPDRVSGPGDGKGIYLRPSGIVWLTDKLGKRILRMTPQF